MEPVWFGGRAAARARVAVLRARVRATVPRARARAAVLGLQTVKNVQKNYCGYGMAYVISGFVHSKLSLTTFLRRKSKKQSTQL